jgi:NRAMP (natural resistance-associated macrophage protein)-like metal ion transporter
VKIGSILKLLGPGFVTGASDDDPAGIGTYIQAGAQFGYSQLWIALFSTPFMIVIQEMSGRIGLVTGQGLASVIRNNYARPVLLFVIAIQVLTNTINIGADLSAMAESAQLLWHIPYYVLLAVVTALTAALIVLVPYRLYATYLKFLGLTLLAYVVTAFTVNVDWSHAVTATFAPHLQWDKQFILTLIAVFGVTISPYAFFWQSDEEVEELVDDHRLTQEESSRPETSRADVRGLDRDTAVGMIFSNVIMFFIIVTAAATLHSHGYGDVQTAAQAAQVMKPLAGPFTFFLFATGIVSSGLLAIPVMAGSSAYAIGGALNWPRSLSKPFWQEWRFYGVIVGSCFIGLLVNALHASPFQLLYYSAVLNGVISPVLLFIVTQIASSRTIMGEFRNSSASSVMGWALCGFMTVALIVFVV